MKEPFFVVTSTGKNCPWARQCITSVKAQSYKNWEHVYVAADDDTESVAREVAGGDTRVRVVRMDGVVIENVHQIWHGLSDDKIVVWLDGDDWLLPGALETLAGHYREGSERFRGGPPWMTYGSFLWGAPPPADWDLSALCTRYPPGVAPRRDRWRASHLKTFRAGLVKRVREKDLKKADGSWADYVTDQIFMLPMLEMAGERYEVISEPLSVYNYGASTFQLHRIRALLPPYDRLEERPW